MSEFCVSFHLCVVRCTSAHSAENNHKHSVKKPYAQFRAGYDDATVFAQAGVSRDNVGVVELHDCFAANEVCA